MNENTRQGREKKIAREELNKKKNPGRSNKKIGTNRNSVSMCCNIGWDAAIRIIWFQVLKKCTLLLFIAAFFLYSLDVNNSFWESDKKKFTSELNYKLWICLCICFFFLLFLIKYFSLSAMADSVVIQSMFWIIYSVCLLFLCFIWLHNLLMLCGILKKKTSYYPVFLLLTIIFCVTAQNYQYIPSGTSIPANNIFNGCDYYETIELGRVYDVFSPYFPEKYPPGTNCRWSGCSPYGTNIVIKCTDMKIPTVILAKNF